MALILSEKQNIAEFIYNSLQKHWDPKLVNLRKRVLVIADLEKWRADVADIWQQKEGEKFYSVYFDNEYVCRVGSHTSPFQLEVDFLKGITQLYENNKIYFDERRYKEETDIIKQIKHDKQEEKKQNEKKIDTLAVNPVVKETLKELNEEDYQKKVISQVEIDKVKKSL